MRAIANLATIAAMIAGISFGHAQSWQMPPENQRCPSKWGAGDQRGSGNMMKPETVLRAARLIKTGEVFELGALLPTSLSPARPASPPTSSPLSE